MCALSHHIREKPNWWEKVKDKAIVEKWREDVLEQEGDEVPSGELTPSKELTYEETISFKRQLAYQRQLASARKLTPTMVEFRCL